MKIIKALCILFFISSVLFAQDDVQIGSNPNIYRQNQGAYFDYSDASGINIKVQLWGYVKYPGYYIVPSHCSLNDLISYAGGPLEDAMMEDVRIFKTSENNKLNKYNLNDLLWNDSLTVPIDFPKLTAGDVIIVPGEPRYFLREDVSFYLSITTALASVVALIISITK